MTSDESRRPPAEARGHESGEDQAERTAIRRRVVAVSGYGYPKFGWMAAVAEDGRITDCRARILMYLALQYVHGGDDWFCVRQSTVAANLHLRRQTVGDALRSARQLGWLELAAPRPRGTGWHQADTYRLTHPEIGTPWSTYSDLESDVRGDAPNSESDVRRHGELGAPPPQSDVRRHGELGAPPRFENTLSPAETPTLQGEDTGCRDTGCKSQGVENSEPGAFSGLFGGVFGATSRNGQRALEAPAPPRLVQSTRPLTDDECCPKHPDGAEPACPICRAFAHARGERLEER